MANLFVRAVPHSGCGWQCSQPCSSDTFPAASLPGERRCGLPESVSPGDWSSSSSSSCTGGAVTSGHLQAWPVLLLGAVGVVRRRKRGARRCVARASVAQAEASETTEDAAEEEAPSPLPKALPARVVKRAADLVIVVSNPIEGKESTQRLPQVGDVVEFSKGAIAYVIALSDFCFIAALRDAAGVVEKGDSYTILAKALKPQIDLDQACGGALIDMWGKPVASSGEGRPMPRRPTDDPEDRNEAAWFNEIVGITRRQRIDSPLHAGVMALDAFVPIGRGQSMLLRLPPKLPSDRVADFLAHIVQAQVGSDVLCVLPVATEEEGQRLREMVAQNRPEVLQQLTIVAGRSGSLGEMVLTMNAALGVAEEFRDRGGNSLLLLDLEPLSKAWTYVAEVSAKEGLAERANRETNKEIDGLTEDLGVELWKYVARKNAITARRRTFLGCFLQRAGRMSEARGGGSLTMLAFARLKDDSTLGRLELEAKLKTVQKMNLDEGVREKAVAKIEKQLAELGEDLGGSGVPDDFIEESKAVTDGHVHFADDTISKDGQLCWSVNMKESVARGITSESVQNRPLFLLKSMNVKMYLMQKQAEERLMEVSDGSKVATAPFEALLRQPVGDVLTVSEETAMFLLALEEAQTAAGAQPLAVEALTYLVRGRIRMENPEVVQDIVTRVTMWAEAQRRSRPEAASVLDLGPESFEELLSSLELRPLERKRVLATVGEPLAEDEAAPLLPVLGEDTRQRYDGLRRRLQEFCITCPEMLDTVADEDASDEALQKRMVVLSERLSL